MAERKLSIVKFARIWRSGEGRLVVNTFHVAYHWGFPVPPPGLDDPIYSVGHHLQAIDTELSSIFRASTSTGLDWEAEIVQGEQEGLVDNYANNGNQFFAHGTRAGAYAPLECAVVLSRLSDAHYPSGRGRMYLSPIALADLDASHNQWDTAIDPEAWNRLIGHMTQPKQVFYAGGDFSTELVLFGDGPDWSPVRRIRANRYLGMQKRRRWPLT